MNIEYLHEFEYLAGNLNFRDTARHFFVSPSVISRHIAAMEEELGTKLFERTKQSVSLTEAGRVFLKSAQSILSEYNFALSEMSHLEQGAKPHVRLGYLHNAARPFIVQFSAYLKEHYPEIELEYKGMTFKNLYYALDDNKVDLNFMLSVFPEERRANCELTTMYRDEFCVVVSIDDELAQHREGIGLGSLVGRQIMLPSPKEYPGLAACMRKVLEANPEIDLSGVREFSDVDSMYIEAEMNGCVGLSTSANYPFSSKNVAYLPILGVDAGIDVNAYIGRTLSGRTLTACKEAIASCQKFLGGYSVLKNAQALEQVRA